MIRLLASCMLLLCQASQYKVSFQHTIIKECQFLEFHIQNPDSKILENKLNVKYKSEGLTIVFLPFY